MGSIVGALEERALPSNETSHNYNFIVLNTKNVPNKLVQETLGFLQWRINVLTEIKDLV